MKRFSALGVAALLFVFLCSCSPSQDRSSNYPDIATVGLCYNGREIVLSGYDAGHISYLPNPEQVYLGYPRFFGGVFVDDSTEGGAYMYDEDTVLSIGFNIIASGKGTENEFHVRWDYELETGEITVLDKDIEEANNLKYFGKSGPVIPYEQKVEITEKVLEMIYKCRNFVTENNIKVLK